MQCGTCSAACANSPADNPFPRKEMAWAAWGLKDRLLTDPDVWLCYQCNDCSTRCPRGAKPGDVLAAVRQECVSHYSGPRLLGKLVNQPRYIPVLLAIPVVLLGLLVRFREAIQGALGIPPPTGETIVYSYSSMFPHWLLNGFFIFFFVLVLIAAVTGVRRFWRALKSSHPSAVVNPPAQGMAASLFATLKRILTHDDFAICTRSRSRFLSHLGVFFGFLDLSVVTLWVITSGFNPLIRSDFVYPFGFWSPWKILANLGGAALLLGCLLMIGDRIRDSERTDVGLGTYNDWAFLITLLLVTVSGFFTELLHYLRLEPHRHVIYFVHLVLVFVLLVNLPFSKFAHIIFRATALVFTEMIGRKRAATPPAAKASPVGEEGDLTEPD